MQFPSIKKFLRRYVLGGSGNDNDVDVRLIVVVALGK